MQKDNNHRIIMTLIYIYIYGKDITRFYFRCKCFFEMTTFVDLATTIVATDILIISNFAAKIKDYIFSRSPSL